MQQTIARRMAESKATAPEFVLTCEVDMEDAVAFRKQLKAAAGEGPAPSFNDFVVKASALALREFPRANGAYRDGKFELYSRINVGIAVAGQDALIVPTIFDADRKALGEISRDARALAERVRAGKITPPELSSGTFSVSNLGMFGIKRFTAVINPPQAAILAVGELTPRPVVHDGEVAVRAVMELTLTCDHRILYGADAAEFLGRIRERLENPLSLALVVDQALLGPPDREPPHHEAEADERGHVADVDPAVPAERGVADELDAVVERVDLAEHLRPLGQPGEREVRARRRGPPA